ncbi:MAG: hypothetical protein IJA60_08525 [Clostridia bacterium]|nr:hypothetical protein [Clostridia bacterium]
MKRVNRYRTVFVITCLAVSLVLFLIIRIANTDHLSKSQIVNLVEGNYHVIAEDISENDFSDTLNLKGIQDVSRKGEIIDFYCGGSGIAPSSKEYGFYYSANDTPCDFVLMGTLKPDGKGYSSSDGNYFYTEKIRKNFYYYEVQF